MEEINIFLKLFEKSLVDPQVIRHEDIKIKKVIFSIFKAIIADFDKRTVLDGLINKFEIDNSSLWNTFELLLKPELKKLNLKIEDIVNQGISIELFNSISKHLPINTCKQTLQIENNENGIAKNKLKKRINQINTEQTLINNNVTIQDSENIDFFDYNEMVKFVHEGVNNPYFEYNESDVSDFSETDDASNLKYHDFFNDKPQEDHEVDYFSLSEAEIISDESKVGENLIKNTQAPNLKLDNFSKISRDKNDMDTIIDELEANIIKEKEWYKLGETSIADREKNSLLDIHLEVPQFSSMNNSIKITDELNYDGITSNDKSNFEEINPYLESIVKQRILNNLFDDVKPKFELLKSLNIGNKSEDSELQIEKSKLSLAEIYSKKYEEQIIGNTIEEYSDEKKQLSSLFTEIMCKLDNLSNQYYATNLPILKSVTSIENAPALKTEDAIPVIISDNTRLAPQEIKSQGRILERHEMTRLERKSERNSMKRRMKKRKKLDSDSIKDHMNLKENINDGLPRKKSKSFSKITERESPGKRLKSHHFII